MAHFNFLRKQYPSLQDGFSLVQLGNWTYDILRPGSNVTQTEIGMWSVSRSPHQTQNITRVGSTAVADTVWMLYTNENKSVSYTIPCSDPKRWISSPYMAGTVVRNLFPPFENYTLQASLSPYYDDGKAPYRGCVGSVAFEPFGFKALVPVAVWVDPRPALTKFTPGHDARVLSNSTNVDISFEFNTAMSCAGLTKALTATTSSKGKTTSPTVLASSVKCGPVTNPPPATIPSGDTSQWSWTGTLQNVPDGITQITLTAVPNAANTLYTGVRTFL